MIFVGFSMLYYEMMQLFCNFAMKSYRPMNQLEKYTWLIDTIRSAGKITHLELSEKWKNNIELSKGEKLHRNTLKRWIDGILTQFGIIISCERAGGYHYFIENPKDIEEDELKKWMIDSFTVGNILNENLGMKERILVDHIPSGCKWLTVIMWAMKESRILSITYESFTKRTPSTFLLAPYCVKAFQNRWYVLGLNSEYNQLRIYGLDRIHMAEPTDEKFKLPKDFNASDYFSHFYGIVVNEEIKPCQVVIRAEKPHAFYVNSLPLHPTQKLIDETDEYADFELFLSPTYDFVLRLFQSAHMVEVLSPDSLRDTMKQWSESLYRKYN